MNTNMLLLKDKAESFGLNLPQEKLKKLEQFGNFLRAYNEHTNLVSANDANLIFDKHIADSLSFGHFIHQNANAKIIDIGSGGGFPVIPMAIILSDCQITSVDSTKKKTDFLEQAATTLELSNLTILNTRAEDLAHKPEYREQFDISTARAVGNLAQISELCLPFIKKDGYFIAYKAAKVQEEIDNAQNAISILGGMLTSIYDYTLHIDENFQRNLVSIQKIQNSPLVYPRSFSAIKNKPL